MNEGMREWGNGGMNERMGDEGMKQGINVRFSGQNLIKFINSEQETTCFKST